MDEPTPAPELESGQQPLREKEYRRQWKAYAYRRNLALGLVTSWLPICIGLYWWSSLSLHRPVACLGIMAVWLTAATVAVWWAGEFRCPRCRRRFGAQGHRKGTTNYTGGIFDLDCQNCKLRKFEIIR